jgi:hypothetical protein
VATIAVPPKERQNAERKFYTRMVLSLVALVFLGFAPSFYLRGIVPPYPRPNPTLPWWVIMHGSLFTIWMGILVAQTQLIAGRQHKLHMTLGTASMIFAILLIPVMYMTAVWAVARANQPPMTDPLTWTIVPLSVIVRELGRRVLRIPHPLAKPLYSAAFRLGLSGYPVAELDFIRYVCMVDGSRAESELGFRARSTLRETIRAVDDPS